MNLPDLSVLYEDNHLLAVDKPAGCPTQSYGSRRESLEAAARLWVKIKKKKPGEAFLHVLGRLDRAASGIVLFARTSKALSRLNEAMRRKEFLRIYHAVTAGSPGQRAGILKHHLLHGSHRAAVVAPGTRGAKEALLEYRVLKRSKGLCLLEILLHTGRYHQIRAQLGAIGAPVAGDRKYGGPAGGLPRNTIALHHARLELQHPVRREPLRIEAPYPPHWPRV